MFNNAEFVYVNKRKILNVETKWNGHEINNTFSRLSSRTDPKFTFLL